MQSIHHAAGYLYVCAVGLKTKRSDNTSTGYLSQNFQSLLNDHRISLPLNKGSYLIFEERIYIFC